MPQHRLVDEPPLLPRDLQYEHVVHVVVVAEALRLRRGHVGVDLDGVAEVRGERLGEVDDRRVRAVQGLQHDRRAVREEPGQCGVVDLVVDGRSDAAAPGEAAGCVGLAVLRDAQERRAQSLP